MKTIAIVGPTATGKTGRAVSLARDIGGEIISGDSRQVYRRMDIGTGKDLSEYGDVPYHLIDICEPGEKYNLHRFLKDFRERRDDILHRGKNVILCGGTGMYVESALSGICTPNVPADLELRNRLERLPLGELTKILTGYKTLHNVTDVDTVKRAVRAIEIEEYYLRHPEEADLSRREKVSPIDALIVGIEISREERRERITRRLHARLAEGMVDEVRGLLASGLNPEDLIYYGLEYKYLTLHVIGELTHDEMVRQLEIAIHQFAKRQMTWFRGMERRGFKINWLPANMSDDEFISEVRMLSGLRVS